jgi:hypothetical protein
LASSADSGSSSSSRRGQGHPLLLAAGQLGGIFGLLVRQPDRRQEFIDARLDLGAFHAAVLQPVGDVGLYRQVREKRVGLKDDAEIPVRRRQARDVPAGLDDPPMGLALQACDDAQQRRLAAARRAQKTDEFAGGNVERHVLQRGKLAEHLGDALDAQIGVAWPPLLVAYSRHDDFGTFTRANRA